LFTFGLEGLFWFCPWPPCLLQAAIPGVGFQTPGSGLWSLDMLPVPDCLVQGLNRTCPELL